MNKNKEIVKNTFILFIGKISTQFLSFLLLPLYTAKLLSSDYGLVDLIITYISLLVPVITLQLETAVFRFLIDNRSNEIEKKKIISTVFFIVIDLIFVFLFLALFFVQFINVKYSSIIIFNVIIIIFSNILLQVSRGLGDNKRFSVCSFIVGSTSIFFNLLFILYFKFGADAILISSCIGNLFGILYLFFSLKIYKYISLNSFSLSLSRKMLKYSIPLIPNGISWWILNVSDRSIISFFLGTSYNGIYSVACKFPNIINGFFSIFGLSWTESASIHIDDDDRDDFFSNIFNNTFKLFSSFCLLLVAALPFVFKIMVAHNYVKAYNYIPLLVLSTFISCLGSIYGGIYIAKKLTKQIAFSSLMVAFINLIVHFLLIKFIGIYAAVISTLVSYLIMTVYRAFDIKKYVNIKYDFNNMFYFICLFIIELFFYYLNNLFYNILILLIICFLSFAFNYNTIRRFFKFIIIKLKHSL